MSDRKVQGHCPWCGRNSLFLGSGGYITCGYIGKDDPCPNPTGITDLLDGETQHIVKITDEGFTIKHPLRERLENDLFECPVHRRMRDREFGPPFALGTYRVYGDGLGDWKLLSP